MLPVGAGVMSALGLLVSPLAFEVARSRRIHVADIDAKDFAATFAALENEASGYLKRAGVPDADIRIVRHLDMRYQGQGHEIEITLPVEALTMGSNGGTAIGFQKLVVAVDAFDSFAETDESNNLRLLSRNEIPRQVIEVAPLEEAAAALAPEVLQEELAAPKSQIDSALEEFGIDQVETEAAAVPM